MFLMKKIRMGVVLGAKLGLKLPENRKIDFFLKISAFLRLKGKDKKIKTMKEKKIKRGKTKRGRFTTYSR